MGIDLAQFHEVFFDESLEALATMESALLELDVASPDPEIINTIFRGAHSIKGGAGMFSFAEIASLTHTLETLLDELRSGRAAVSQDACDLLLRSVDLLREMLRATRDGQALDSERVAALRLGLEALVAGQACTSPRPRDGDTDGSPRPRVAAEAPAGEPPRPASAPTAADAAGDSGSIRVGVRKIDELINTVGEIVITQSMLAQLGLQMQGPAAERLRTGLAQLERNVRELHEGVMRVRMLPIGFAFSRFPRMVRDLAQRLGKQIELRVSGEQTELDKTVLERIGDPLVHLVRNCIDHGIERPEERIQRGKPPAGTVRLDAFHRGSAIIIEISDDGRGLDRDRILAKARSRGLLGPADAPADAALYDLIFLPGFSTVEQTTDLSGRGVGMDVVRGNVKALGGKIEIHSEPGRGCRFVITLPLTLAIVEGQSVRVGGNTFVVPLVSIVESLQLKSAAVTRLTGAGEVFAFRGDYVPLVRLHRLFGIEPRAQRLHDGLVVVAEGDGRRVGLFVDDLRGQQQVVIKSLESNYGTVSGFSGATIMGDGSVALILDVPDLIRRICGREASRPGAASSPSPH